MRRLCAMLLTAVGVGLLVGSLSPGEGSAAVPSPRPDAGGPSPAPPEGAAEGRAAAGAARTPAPPGSPPVPCMGSGEPCLAAQRRWMLSEKNLAEMEDPKGYNGLGGLERPLIAAIKAASGGKPPLFVDAGANVGQELQSWAPIAEETGGDVILVEPHPRTNKELVKNVRRTIKRFPSLSGRLRPMRVALGNESRTVTFWGNFGKRARPVPGTKDLPDTSVHASMARTRAHSHSVSVRMQRLDEMIAPEVGEGRRVALLKTDCQGWDHWVLVGASGVLSAIDVIVFEYDALLWHQGTVRLLDTMRFLCSAGFAVLGKAFPHLMVYDPQTFAWQEAHRPADLLTPNWLPSPKAGHTKTTFNMIAFRRDGPLGCALGHWVRGVAAVPECTGEMSAMLPPCRNAG
eukprot:TRINITY_DN45231_c0_g1_i1.p1 TRINITY_DN45231_c0_g1~~TRINITY_DN45231_c0_g1_i1.p1  ORF type:complete len:433 (+),score=113.88 TRINITY_DN45231_c0_g1_i1:95-1300(+)